MFWAIVALSAPWQHWLHRDVQAEHAEMARELESVAKSLGDGVPARRILKVAVQLDSLV